jgi:hypothetical protein
LSEPPRNSLLRSPPRGWQHRHEAIGEPGDATDLPRERHKSDAAASLATIGSTRVTTREPSRGGVAPRSLPVHSIVDLEHFVGAQVQTGGIDRVGDRNAQPGVGLDGHASASKVIIAPHLFIRWLGQAGFGGSMSLPSR